MKQTVIAATAAALLASATFGVAATTPRTDDVGHQRPSPAEMAENAAAFSDARIAGLKAGLRMNAEQEKLWPAVEQALRDLAQQRIDGRIERMEAFRERKNGEHPNLLGRMRSRADTLVQRGDGLKKLVDAADPLYASLDEAQKHRFDILLRRARFAEWDGPPGRGWRHQGPHGFHDFQHRAPRHGGQHGPHGGADDQGEEQL